MDNVFIERLWRSLKYEVDPDFSRTTGPGIMVDMQDDQQFDLFSLRPAAAKLPVPTSARPTVDVAALVDDDLIAAMTTVSKADTMALVAEAGRRRLAAAVPALEAVCRRFTGFGGESLVAEQAVALEALAAIGGPEAASAVARIIGRRQVQGPTLAVAMSAASRLAVNLPAARILELLKNSDPRVRADACRCARFQVDVVTVLIDLLDDLNDTVPVAAACALGRMGRIEALPMLIRMLNESPSIEIIEATANVADDDTIVRLGRLARTKPDLADAVLDALDVCDGPLATKVADGLRKRWHPSSRLEQRTRNP